MFLRTWKVLRISAILIFPFNLLLVIVILIPSSTQKEPLGLDEWFVKLYIEFVTMFPFYVWVFGCKACGIRSNLHLLH